MQRIIKTNIQSGFALAAVTAVSLAMIGGTSAAAMNSTKQDAGRPTHANAQQSNNESESQAARDLRIGLDKLLQEHVVTNLDVNRAITSGAPQAELDAALAAQTANTTALSAAIGSIYGVEAGDQFFELFDEHIIESNAFAMAIAAGDKEAEKLALIELDEYLEDITNFVVTAIPVLPYETVYGLLQEHEKLVNKSTSALEEKNFGQSNKSDKFEQRALVQISVIADALASGIIQTQPTKF